MDVKRYFRNKDGIKSIVEVQDKGIVIIDANLEYRKRFGLDKKPGFIYKNPLKYNLDNSSIWKLLTPLNKVLYDEKDN